jgi:ribulose-phosphate 3-epimerase
MALIAPSLLACNFLQLESECIMINNSQAHWFHLDVMDGNFVPNISFGIPIVEHIKKVSTKPLDVHLMIANPHLYIDAFKNAGANIITVHVEACTHLHSTIDLIKKMGIKAGVALNPHTPIGMLTNVLEYIDLVCIMSVNPGFGGQKFIANTINKIKELDKIKTDKTLNFLIEIDGGVTLENAKSIVDAGANVLVAGSTVFNDPNPIKIIELLASL